MRSFIFFIVMVIIFGLVDTSWQLVNWYHMRQTVLNARIALTNDKKPDYSVRHISREKMIDMFMVWVEMSGLSLSTLSITKNEETDFDVNAEFVGQFQQIVKFFSELSGQCFPFFVRDLVISKKENSLKLKLGATVSAICVYSKLQHLRPAACPRDPACARVVGFLRYPDHLVVIAREPSGRVREKNVLIKKE